MKIIKYHAWKADKNCNPISDTDKFYAGKSCRSIIKHIAYENGIKAPWYAKNIIKLLNGLTWCVYPVYE